MCDCITDCWELRLERQKNVELSEICLNLGKDISKPWYSPNDIEGYQKYMTLMFTLESNERGEKFAMAIRSWSFPILNHFLLNTELGKETFPGLTLKNLRVVCLYKEYCNRL